MFPGSLAGAYEVLGNASLTSTSGFEPDSLLVDGATVVGVRIGGAFTTGTWDLTVRGGATVTVEGQAHSDLTLYGTVKPGLIDNSVLTYGGKGNVIETNELYIGGELVQEKNGASLDLKVSSNLLVASQFVRVVSGETVTIPFDSENVWVEIMANPGTNFVEGSGPDYNGNNPGGVLFADSPCVRRWGKVTIQPGVGETNLVDSLCSSPISGSPFPLGCAGAPPGGVAESLYVTDLEVPPGAVLVAGSPSPPAQIVNIYYTGTLTPNPPLPGSIVDIFGNDYTPIQLKPSLYGDFNATGSGDEPDEPGSDTRRFNDAFCTCIGQANYDILVDWNCDGVIDDLDRDQYNANWSSPAAITTDVCSGPCS